MPRKAPTVPAAPARLLRLATWNINSVRLRIGLLARLAQEANPDVICLQETKAPDEVFPHEAIRAMGYAHQHFAGMKGYNGVAILSRVPLDATGGRDWCARGDCRHVQAVLPGDIELHNLYVPAGGDIPDPAANPKFAHKLQFLTEQTAWWQEQPRDGRKRILVGDLNIAPLESDVWSHTQLLDVVSHTPVEVEHLARLREAQEWVDAVRHFVPAPQKLYTWWSYRARDWAASDRGRRLDHVWVSQALKPALRGAEVLKPARDWPQASDHVPVVVELAP